MCRPRGNDSPIVVRLWRLEGLPLVWDAARDPGMPHHLAFDGNSVSTAMAFRNESTALIVDLSFNDQRGERMTRFEFTPELRLRDGRVVRNSDDALEITRAAYNHTAGREEILHWL